MHLPQSLLRISAAVFIGLFVVPTVVAQKMESTGFRTWETAEGRKSDVRLKLVKVEDTSIRLQREDNGKVVSLPLNQLSSKDRRYVQRQLAKAGAGVTNDPSEEEDSNRRPVSRAAETWSQWRGARRDGKSSDTGLLNRWDATPPLDFNVRGLGEGYSTPATTQDAIYVLGTGGTREFIFKLNWDGEIQWKTPVGNKTDGGGYPGPRGTPTIVDGMAYAVTSDGTVSAIDAESGAVKWQKSMKRDFGGECGHWGFAESPLVDGECLICTPGGSGRTVVALDRRNGRTIWNASLGLLNQTKPGYTTAGYASPIVANVQGVSQYVVFLNGGVVGVQASDGSPLWHYESPANDTANCSTPLVHENSVFAASGYGTGGGRALLQRQGNAWNVREAYFVKRMQNHHGGFLLHDGFLYGTNENSLLCIDWRSGNIVWQDRSVGKGSISYADGKLFVRGEGGEVALVQATPEGYRELGRFSQPDRSGRPAWPHPVIANGRLLLRDEDRLLSFQISSQPD